MLSGAFTQLVIPSFTKFTYLQSDGLQLRVI